MQLVLISPGQNTDCTKEGAYLLLKQFIFLSQGQYLLHNPNNHHQMATTYKYLQGKQRSMTNLFKIITGNSNLWYIEVDDVVLCVSLATLRTLSKYKQ